VPLTCRRSRFLGDANLDYAVRRSRANLFLSTKPRNTAPQLRLTRGGSLAPGISLVTATAPRGQHSPGSLMWPLPEMVSSQLPPPPCRHEKWGAALIPDLETRQGGISRAFFFPVPEINFDCFHPGGPSPHPLQKNRECRAVSRKALGATTA